jgi:hypothetical protein
MKLTTPIIADQNEWQTVIMMMMIEAVVISFVLTVARSAVSTPLFVALSRQQQPKGGARHCPALLLPCCTGTAVVGEASISYGLVLQCRPGS